MEISKRMALKLMVLLVIMVSTLMINAQGTENTQGIDGTQGTKSAQEMEMTQGFGSVPGHTYPNWIPECCPKWKACCKLMNVIKP